MGKTICVFGDSITWGAYDDEGGAWVQRLKRYVEAEYDYNITVYNQGVGGDNTGSLLERFVVECAAREPQIIIIAIGANDSQYVRGKNNPRVPVDKFKSNLEELIRQAEKISGAIVFVGLTKVDEGKTMPIPWKPEIFYDNENIATYNSAIREICAKCSLLFIELMELLDLNDLGDGLHPNSEGHKKMFLKIKEFLLAKKII